MATFDVKNIDGQKVGDIELDDAVFGAEVKEGLLWEVVKWQQAKRRAGTHSTLRRDEVRGGGKKPFRQKGTGNARQGSIRAPHYVGGGRVFTPKPRDYEYAIPKKGRAGALRSALSLRAKEAKLIVVDGLVFDAPKTKRAAAAIAALGGGKTLIVDSQTNHNLSLSIRNLPSAKFVGAAGVNVYDILNHESLILTRDVAIALQDRLRPIAKEGLNPSAGEHGEPGGQ